MEGQEAALDADEAILEQVEAMQAARDPISKQPAAPIRRTKGLLAAAMRSASTESMATVPKMPKRRITFVVSATACNPGVFPEDFELTMESLSSRTELEAAKKSKGDPTSLSMWLAFYGMSAVNGESINDGEGEREWLWEALGPARNLVLGLYARGCMVDPESQGKALSSLRVE